MSSPDPEIIRDSIPAPSSVTQNYPPLPKSEQTQCQNDDPNELSDLQHAAIKLLLTGHSLTSIALDLGVARKTLYNWRHKDLIFRTELSRRREDLYGQASDRYRSLLNSAMDALERQVKTNTTPPPTAPQEPSSPSPASPITSSPPPIPNN